MPRTAKENTNRLRTIHRILERMYGPIAPRPRCAGLDMLVEAMLAQNTNMANAMRGYRMLRRRFPSWTKVMNAPIEDVQRQIAICGLSRMRAKRLQNLLRILKARHGKLSLEFLADQTPEAGFEYLMGLYGIGPKTAAFVLLFAFGHAVLPVDNGILRVARRLRLVRLKARDLEAQRVLSPLIPAGTHYAMHLLLFRHARERCRPKNPKCTECDLLKLCPHGQRIIRHAPPARNDRVPAEVPRIKRHQARYISAGVRKHGGGEE